jgi:replicative DNA helicase
MKLVEGSAATKKSWIRYLENSQRDWGLYGHDMGIHDLNMTIGGWIPTKVTTIGGRSGMGKTAMVLPMFDAGKQVINGRRCEFCFFTWEMESSFIVDRYITYKTNISSRYLTQGAKLLSLNDKELIKSAYDEAYKLPVSFQEHSLDISHVKKVFTEFVEQCKEKAKIEGIEIIPVGVVDYIGMASFSGSGLRTYGIGEFMSEIKSMCNHTGGCFLNIAQINRGADTKDMPDRADFADSQSIENNSDNLVVIHRPEYNQVSTVRNPKTGEDEDAVGKMMLRILKSRDYGTGDVLLGTDIKRYKFWNLGLGEDFDYRGLYSDENFWKESLGLANR